MLIKPRQRIVFERIGFCHNWFKIPVMLYVFLFILVHLNQTTQPEYTHAFISLQILYFLLLENQNFNEFVQFIRATLLLFFFFFPINHGFHKPCNAR